MRSRVERPFEQSMKNLVCVNDLHMRVRTKENVWLILAWPAVGGQDFGFCFADVGTVPDTGRRIAIM